MDSEMFILEITDKMDKTLDNLGKRFATVRAGRANPSSLDGIMVEYYGTKTRLKEIAGITEKEVIKAVLDADIHFHDIIFKATMVDGVYDCDPHKFENAKKYDELTFSEVLNKGLAVMDSTAASLCRDNNIDILVFNLNDYDNIVRAVEGENIGTVVKE